MIKILSPTGEWNLRADNHGSGIFGAPRGDRMHNGIDLRCYPGQRIYAPVTGRILRKAYPYPDLSYNGFIIRDGKAISIAIFYAKIFKELIGQKVSAGDHIALAEDISRRYGGGMLPHVHMEVRIDGALVDPLGLMA